MEHNFVCLSLALLVAGIALADDADHAFAPNNLAILTAFAY
jgi:hypothetical protein